MIYKTFLRIFLLLATMIIIGCSINVPIHKVFGNYKATYPFGIETITLNRDGSFIQEIKIKDQEPVTIRGKWDFDSHGSRVNFDGLISVVDGTGKVRNNWRTAAPGVASLDVEMHWFRIIMASAATYSYIKD